MARAYYELLDDLHYDSRWHLDGLFDNRGIELDSREFTYGKRIDLGPPMKCSLWNDYEVIETAPPLRVTQSRLGNALDFTFSDSSMPIVTGDVAQLLRRIAAPDIQIIPVRVDGIAADYHIINVVSSPDCIDTYTSEIEWWKDNNEIRPDKAGMPRMITKLVVDANRISRHDICRPYGWEIALVVSETVRTAFEAAEVTGVDFRRVTK